MLSAMISVLNRSFPCLSCHLRVRSFPSTNTCEPLRRYSAAISPRRPKKAMLCHSVRSCCAPEALSFHVSLVAMRMFVTDIPLGMDRVSGSAPSVPIKITLFTPRAIHSPHSLDGGYCTRARRPHYQPLALSSRRNAASPVGSQARGRRTAGGILLGVRGGGDRRGGWEEIRRRFKRRFRAIR